MPTYLVHKPTGDKYIYTKTLADRPDMVVLDEPDIAPAGGKPAATRKPRKAAKKAEEPKAEEPKAEEPKAEEPKAEEPKAEESGDSEEEQLDMDALFSGTDTKE